MFRELAEASYLLTCEQYYSAMKDAYVSYFRLRNMALYDFKSEQDLENIYLKNNRK